MSRNLDLRVEALVPIEDPVAARAHRGAARPVPASGHGCVGARRERRLEAQRRRGRPPAAPVPRCAGGGSLGLVASSRRAALLVLVIAVAAACERSRGADAGDTGRWRARRLAVLRRRRGRHASLAGRPDPAAATSRRSRRSGASARATSTSSRRRPATRPSRRHRSRSAASCCCRRRSAACSRSSPRAAASAGASTRQSRAASRPSSRRAAWRSGATRARGRGHAVRAARLRGDGRVAPVRARLRERRALRAISARAARWTCARASARSRTSSTRSARRRVVAGDLVIVGSAIGDNRRVDMPRGVVRAYDARSGRLRWSWDPIPRDANDPAHAGWDPESAQRTGAANAWAPLSLDAERDLLFVPTSSPSPDYYGGLRPGDNRYANSVVALRASTGARSYGASSSSTTTCGTTTRPRSRRLRAYERDGVEHPRRRAGQQDGPPVRAPPRDRRAGLRRRGAAGADVRRAWRARLAHAAGAAGAAARSCRSACAPRTSSASRPGTARPAASASRSCATRACSRRPPCAARWPIPASPGRELGRRRRSTRWPHRRRERDQSGHRDAPHPARRLRSGARARRDVARASSRRSSARPSA